jgi:hypothetical protein
MQNDLLKPTYCFEGTNEFQAFRLGLPGVEVRDSSLKSPISR